MSFHDAKVIKKNYSASIVSNILLKLVLKFKII